MERASKRILAVDDDPLVTKLLRINLELSGYRVEEAWDGESALRVLAEDPPDLVVLDLMMPCVDGWQILQEIRRNETLKDIPVMILSARVHDEDIIRGWEMGADDYITKPFNPVRMTERLEAVMNSTPEERRERRRRELRRLTGAASGPGSQGG